MPGKISSLCCLPPQLCAVMPRFGMTGRVNRCWLALEYVGDRKILKARRMIGLGGKTNGDRNQNGANKDSHNVTPGSLAVWVRCAGHLTLE